MSKRRSGMTAAAPSKLTSDSAPKDVDLPQRRRAGCTDGHHSICMWNTSCTHAVDAAAIVPTAHAHCERAEPNGERASAARRTRSAHRPSRTPRGRSDFRLLPIPFPPLLWPVRTTVRDCCAGHACLASCSGLCFRVLWEMMCVCGVQLLEVAVDRAVKGNVRHD